MFKSQVQLLHDTQNLSTQKTTFMTVKFSDDDVKVNHTDREVLNTQILYHP